MENIAIKIAHWFDRKDWVQNEPRQLHKNFKFQRQTKNIRKCQETEGYYFFINEISTHKKVQEGPIFSVW